MEIIHIFFSRIDTGEVKFRCQFISTNRITEVRDKIHGQVIQICHIPNFMTLSHIFPYNGIKQRVKIIACQLAWSDYFRITAIPQIVICQHKRFCFVFRFQYMQIKLVPIEKLFKTERQHLYLKILACQYCSHFTAEHSGITACYYKILSHPI